LRIDLAVIEWTDGPEGGARLLGRIDDADLVAEARARLAERRRAELAVLEQPARAPLRRFPAAPREPNG